ncbi:AT-rich interactive domain-containing protein 1-like isoform X3 [Helianthus annuus]|uniref:AT-rich interactive domain-containing protein 1-like isoform X3 n=1 Tax=Helianthus annuus TaxID=4232 RepID=UPI0016530500|nr:AT-rich interactive domain-containing protein 1-like isoform X3 [Helianthus annuus]
MIDLSKKTLNCSTKIRNGRRIDLKRKPGSFRQKPTVLLVFLNQQNPKSIFIVIPICTVIWPMKNPTPGIEGCAIGKGRPESCGCMTPGSVLCVKRHIIEKTNHLQTVLGPAFQKWKFDLMGEAVAKLWKQQEEQRLTHLMKNNRFLEDK